MAKPEKQEQPEKEKKREKAKDIKHLFGILNGIAGSEEKDPAARMLGDNMIAKVSVITTGSIALDAAIGVGGYPRGRVVEIYGPEACGKTTLTLSAIAARQAAGGKCAFLDMEHALDPKLAEGCGVDIKKLVFAQPSYGEQCLDMLRAIVESGLIDLVVVDSVAALVPKAELDGGMEKDTMGAQARMMGKGLRKISGIVNQSKTVVIFINQLREKIGVMFGNPETTPGGKALKFFASLRLDVRRKEPITLGGQEGSKTIGNTLHVKVVKNKVAAPFEMAQIDVIYGKGVDNTKDIIELGVEHNIIAKAGSFHQYGKSPKLNGAVNFREYLIQHPEDLKEIDDKLRAILLSNKVVGTVSEDDEEDKKTEQELANIE